MGLTGLGVKMDGGAVGNLYSGFFGYSGQKRRRIDICPSDKDSRNFEARQEVLDQMVSDGKLTAPTGGMNGYVYCDVTIRLESVCEFFYSGGYAKAALYDSDSMT